MPVELIKKRFTVHDYHRMGEAGILTEDDRVELIDGEILAMSPIGPPHNAAVNRANRAMVQAAGEQAIVGVQGSIRLDDFTEPQPDVVLLRPREDFYATRHPGSEDIFLIVEMADSSLEYDLGIKAGLYARKGVVEYWVADIRHDCLWIHSDPHGESDPTNRRIERGEWMAPRLLADCRVQVDAMLP
jgi:Uma2 family endonuclease